MEYVLARGGMNEEENKLIEKMQELVESYLRNGYELSGGLTYVKDEHEDRVIIVQALTKEEKEIHYYTIIAEDENYNLTVGKINERLLHFRRSGWKAQGGINVTYNSEEKKYHGNLLIMKEERN